MRKLFILFILLSAPAFAQRCSSLVVNPSTGLQDCIMRGLIMVDTTANITAAACTLGDMAFSTNAGAGQNVYFCTATNTWTQMSATGSTAFSAITTATNANTLTMGTGGTMTTSGTGVINANQVNGVTVPASMAVAGSNSSSQLAAATANNVWGVLYGTGAGTAQAQTVTLAPAVSSINIGIEVCWLPLVANSGAAPTLAVGTFAAKPITKFGTTAVVANDITTTAIACATYDGTEYQLQNPQTNTVAGAGIAVSTGGIWGASLTETDGNIIAGVTGAWTKVTALPNGITATTQSQADGSTKVATTSYVDTGLATKAASNAATTVNGQSCTLSSTCNVNSGNTAHTVSLNEGNGSALGAVSSTGLTGQVLTAQNGADPVLQSSGIPTRVVAGATDTILCDSATLVRDRSSFVQYTSASAVAVTLPQAGSSGCSNNFVVGILVTGAGTVTVTPTTSTLTTCNGNSCTTGNLALTTGQYVVIHSPDNTNYLGRLVTSSTLPASVNVLATNGSGTGIAATAGNIAAIDWVAGGGTAQAQTATYSPAITALVDGLLLCWKPTAANTAAAPTFSPNGLTAQSIVNINGAALVANDIITTQQACAIYNSTGTRWELTNPQGQLTPSAKIAVGTSPPACAGGNAAAICIKGGTGPTGEGSVLDFFLNASQQAAVNENNTAVMTLSKGLTVNVTPATVNTSTASDQNLMAFTLPANTLNIVGRTLKIWLKGVYSNVVTAQPTVALKVKLCTVSGCGTGTVITPISIVSTATNATAVTNLQANLVAYITTQTAGSSSAYEASGNMAINLGTANTTALSTFGDTNTATVGTIDSTLQLFLQVAVAFSGSSTSNSFTARQLVVEVVN